VKVERQPEVEIDLSRVFEKKEEAKPRKKGRNKPKPKVEESKKEKRNEPSRKNSANPEWDDQEQTHPPKLENLASICSTNPSETELPLSFTTKAQPDPTPSEPQPIDPAILR
jgi:hypothetical protein